MFLRIREEIKKLHPAYFGLVMSTGIVSIGMHFLGWPILPRVLLWVNIFSYVILWIMNILRIVIYPRRFLVDMSDHLRGVGFFTFVAATGVLAAQLIVISDDILSAKILWYLGAGLWLLLCMEFFSRLL